MPKTAVTPVSLADRILALHLSPNEMYGVVLDHVSHKDFTELENAIMGQGRPVPGETEESERALAHAEVCFLLGYELGKRIGGAR